MKVTIDPNLCEGNAVCEALAPAIFSVVHDEQAHLLVDDVDESQRQLVQRAADGCPRMAITVSD
jgi:ferredoxin